MHCQRPVRADERTLGCRQQRPWQGLDDLRRLGEHHDGQPQHLLIGWDDPHASTGQGLVGFLRFPAPCRRALHVRELSGEERDPGVRNRLLLVGEEAGRALLLDRDEECEVAAVAVKDH